jgi:hypothetical protein
MKNPPEINEYIQTRPRNKISNWNKYTIDGQIVVNFMGRYERLNDDLLEVSKRLGLPAFSLPNAKTKIRINYEHYSRIINPVTRTCIEKMCESEIDHFGYHWMEE